MPQISRREAFDLLEKEARLELVNTELKLSSLRAEAATILHQQDKLIATLEIITALRQRKSRTM